jgi:hypothetical protein
MTDDPRRQNIALIGETEIGKTTAFMKMIDDYDRGMVTILNYQNEPDICEAYPEIPLYPENDSPACIANQVKGVYQCQTTDWKGFIGEQLKNYHRDSKKSGMIVLDDASSYVLHLYQPLLDLMIGLRHKKLDIIHVHHQLWRVPPFIIDNCQVLILFKTGEAIEKGDVKRFRHGDKIMEAQRIVEAHPDKHFCKMVKLTGYQP